MLKITNIILTLIFLISFGFFIKSIYKNFIADLLLPKNLINTRIKVLNLNNNEKKEVIKFMDICYYSQNFENSESKKICHISEYTDFFYMDIEAFKNVNKEIVMIKLDGALDTIRNKNLNEKSSSF